MKRIIILFVLLLMSCEKNPNNIEIKKEEFKSIINKVDDKSVILRETMKRINTSKDPKELKSALLSLSDGDIELSEIDINDFFNNNKTIEL